MKILLHNSHPPYSFDLMRGMPDAYFYHVGWAHFLRPELPNMNIVHNISTIEGEEFDVIIADNDNFWFSDIHRTLKTNKRIHIFHCQNCHSGNTEIMAKKEAVCKAVDAIVLPSEHKMMTYTYLSFKYPFHAIPLGVSGEDYSDSSQLPIETKTHIGAIHNVVQEFPEISNWWGITTWIMRRYPKVLIGQANQDIGYHDCEIWIPKNWDEYKNMITHLRVGINIVPSEIAGYTPREIMASGVPLVTGIMSEFHEMGFHGWNIMRYLGSTKDGLFKIADTAKYLYDNPEYAREIGHWGRKTILRKYSLKIFQEMWRELICK